jgi:nucleotide-binding universal stress UspA family protein
MKVLIGVDGSSGSFEAIALVSRIVDAGRDQIALYYSAAEMLQGPAGQSEPGIRDRARQALADAVFVEAKKRLPAALRDGVHTIAGAQRPAHGLLVAADNWRADVIAVGSRGLGPIQNVLLGSVARGVVQAGTLPVLVARGSSAGQESLRLLVAYDRASAARVAELLGQITWPKGSTGRVMRVVESFLAGPLPAWLEQQARDADAEAMAQAWVSEHEEEVRQQREELAAYIAQLPSAFRGQAPIVCEGHPADQILKTIAADAVDLIVVGKTAERGLARMILGSTSARVLSHTQCSVLVVPPHETP